MRAIEEIVDDMPTIFKNAINGLRQIHNAPLEMLVPMVLTTASIGAQLKFKLKLHYKTNIPLCLWSIILADSGTRKSSVQSNLLQPITDYEESKIEPYAIELEDYEFNLGLWKKDKIAKNPQDLPRPNKPISPDIMTPTCTLNGIINHLSYNSFGALITSEGSQFFDGHSMSKNSGKREEMTSNLNALFTGDVIGKMTGVERIKLVNRQFVISLMTQPNLATILLDKKLQDQGFWARFMITQTPPSTTLVGGYIHNAIKINYSDVNEKMIYPLGNAVVKMIETHNRNLSTHITNGDNIGNFKYNTITHSNDSGDYNDAWEKAYIGKINESASKGTEVLDIPYLQRIQTMGTKISAVLSAFEDSSKPVSMNLADMRARFHQQHTDYEIGVNEAIIGLELAEWFYEQRLKLDIQDSDNLNEVVTIGDDLMEWFGKKNITTISKSKLDQGGLYKYRKQTKEIRQKIIEELITLDRLYSKVEDNKLILGVVK